MWIFLFLGALIATAVSRSPREAHVRPRQLALPPPLPGPIAVLGEIVRIGQVPPPTVILCAIAEAEAIGRDDLASDIIRVFVAPVVQQHAWVPSVPYAIAPHTPAMRTIPEAFVRESCAIQPASSRSLRDMADAPRFAPPARVQPPAPAVQARPQRALGERSASDDEIRAMLNADPEGFVAMATRGLPAAKPLQQIAAPLPASQPPVIHADPEARDALAAQLLQLPGHVGAGVVSDLSSGTDVFEVRWLRGYPIPALPQAIDGHAVRLVVVDALPVLHPAAADTSAALPSMDLPPEMVADLQEAGLHEAAEGLHEAADQTRALAPGSPLAGVSDDAWRDFVVRLEREPPTFSSGRHVGQYRQCRDRLAELGIDPRTLGSAQAQRVALDVDLVDAHRHAMDGGLLTEHIGRAVAIPGRPGTETITLSGALGVIQCAGLDGAVGWLEKPGDRKRFPYTTQVFLRTNGGF